MADSNQYSSMVSNIAYHDYLVLLCYMDAEWTRRRPSCEEPERLELFLGNHRHFTRRCCKYRDDINDNYEAFTKANQIEPQEPLASYLFNPMCYFPFGHADDFGIVLLDDFDPVDYLTAQTNTTLEEVCLAFCPKLESLGAGKTENPFCELHELFGDNPKMPKAESPLFHSFQENTPLLVFTKYKMDGLATVGQGLLFQQNLFRAMVNKIREATTLLRNRIAVDNTVKGLMSKEDINLVKCAFLDLQGSEEVGTLIFCRNYSVAITLVAALRSMTFGDVFKADIRGDIERLLNNSKAHRSIIQLGQKEGSPLSDISLLSESHAFRWTHSSLSVSPNAFFNSDHSCCNGHVEALAEFQISPGHRLHVEENVAIASGEQNEGPTKENTYITEYYRYQIGTGDLILPYAPTVKESRIPLLPTKSALKIVKKNLLTFGRKRERKDLGRDVVDMMTSMIIPVPKIVEDQTDLICGNVGKGHFHPLVEVLPLIRDRLCYYSHIRGRLGGQEIRFGPCPGRLDLDKLKEIPRTYGVPVSLRRTIENLYQDFAILIADPFLFDAVLDLYDTFATLHALLTEHLPSVRSREIGNTPADGLGFLDEGRTEQLSMLVDAIYNALMHRIAKAYPEAQIREMAIDFRGGLNQILLAADAPVKCGLGLVRKYSRAEDDEESIKDRAKHRDTVGGLTRIGFMPGAKCYSLMFGAESYAKLTYFEVDVPHVLHIASYCDNLHESFHLIFDVLCDSDSADKELFHTLGSVMRDRASEVFASLLSQTFLFGSDVDTFLYHHLCSYSKSLTSMGSDDTETMARFTELLIRLFLVTDAIPRGKDPRSWGNTWIRETDKTKDALSRFEEMVSEVGLFFPEYERLWSGNSADAVKSFCRKQFEEIYPRMAKLMPRIWSRAMRIYRRFYEDTLCLNGSYKYNDEEIRKNIEIGLTEGSPLVRGLYGDLYNYAGTPSDNKPSKNEGDIGVDPLVLVCQILYQYIQKLNQAKGKAIHLYRKPNERKVEYPHLKDRQWYEFQIDRGAAAMFCPVPSVRRERLRKQIVVLKTFWDISSSLRERRLWEMISDNWPESELLT